MAQRRKRKLFVAGREIAVSVDPLLGERAGDGESVHGNDGECDWGDGVIIVSAVDDSSLAHEVGHIISRARGVYLSEFQIQTFEELFSMCRDPRNKWFVEYLLGPDLKVVKE